MWYMLGGSCRDEGLHAQPQPHHLHVEVSYSCDNDLSALCCFFFPLLTSLVTD